MKQQDYRWCCIVAVDVQILVGKWWKGWNEEGSRSILVLSRLLDAMMRLLYSYFAVEEKVQKEVKLLQILRNREGGFRGKVLLRVDKESEVVEEMMRTSCIFLK